MELYGRKSSSMPQKLFILLAEVLLVYLSWRILFSDSFSIAGVTWTAGTPMRRIILFSFNIIVFIRFMLTLFYLLQRKIPLEETFSVPTAFALYYVGYAILGYSSMAPLNLLDFTGIAIFVAGSFLNTYAEIDRHLWKKKPENKGHLYTGGLFSLSMHINYFGDLLWVSGYTLITHNIWAWIIPVLLFFFFYFYNIPKLDAYLERKYPNDFMKFRQGTKKFIPFIL